MPEISPFRVTIGNKQPNYCGKLYQIFIIQLRFCKFLKISIQVNACKKLKYTYVVNILQSENMDMAMSDNEIKFNLAEYLVGMENRLSAEIKGVEANVNRVDDNVNRVEANVQADIKDVKADNNKRHDEHARETRDKIKELKVSIRWWIGIGLALVTIVLGILEYNSSKNSAETTVNHEIKLR